MFNRRSFLTRSALGLGGVALAELLHAADAKKPNPFAGILDKPHHAPKAKRIIDLFMSGGPSQLDLFDHKPKLNDLNGQDLPESVRMGQRVTGMTAHQATLPMNANRFPLTRSGGQGWPSSSASFGLWSNRSSCEGAPIMWR